MIDVQSQIIKKFPNIENSPMLKKSVLKVASKVIKEDTINKFINENSHLDGLDFVEAVLDYFNFDFSYSSNDIQNIPSTGRVVIIANHPLGALDALCLLKLVGSVRKDVKIVANDFLSVFEPLDELFIKVDNFKSKQTKDSIHNIYSALESEMAVIIFPYGEVSRVTPTGIKDGKWQKGFLKFASKTQSPIVPVFIDAKNSKLFYTISIVNRTFSTVLLSSEMFKQKDNKINMKVGNLIPYNSFNIPLFSKEYLVALFRKHLYSLKKGKKSFFQTLSPLANAQDKKELKKELKSSQLLGQTNDGKKIYLYSYKKDGTVLKEIGRLREISFRKVNEGVNQKRDIDKYDKYYKHIVLWDDEDLEIVGAYRIGECKDIYHEYGFDGFYTNTLFKFEDEFKNYIDDSIELGRSFVQPKYWGSRALDYLWFGIGAYLKNNPNIKYMYGPVSLSGALPKSAKELMVHFYSNSFKPNKNIVTALSPFLTPNDSQMNSLFCFKEYKSDFKVLKTVLGTMDISVPTLYKQYSELCEDGGVEFHGFNIDYNFSECLDGFIFVDISKIKESKKDRYIK